MATRAMAARSLPLRAPWAVRNTRYNALSTIGHGRHAERCQIKRPPLAIFPIRHASVQTTPQPDHHGNPKKPTSMDIARQILKETFGHVTFRHEQEAAIKALLDGDSAAVIFPTGAGKSLCYQIPALVFEHLDHASGATRNHYVEPDEDADEDGDPAFTHGVTIVVSPLLALMKDQVDALVARGVPAVRLDSTLTSAETRITIARIKKGEYKLIYVAPERLTNELFRAVIRHVKGGVRLLAVDEAHCISEWGHSFRPEYLKVARFAKEQHVERVLCLTATANSDVIDDICKGFNVSPVNVFRTTPYRPNLFLEAKTCRKKGEKWQPLLDWLDDRPGQTIIYVTTQKQTIEIAAKLVARGCLAAAFHAGMDSEAKEGIQDAFMINKIQIIVATIAFGMGIDKSNIRNIVHYDLPCTLENYSQQIGRAGRDGKPSSCLIFICPEDFYSREVVIRGDLPSLKSIEGLLRQIVANSIAVREGRIFQVSHFNQSREFDLRITSLENIYAILELRFKLLRETTPIFSTFQFIHTPEILAIIQKRSYIKYGAIGTPAGNKWTQMFGENRHEKWKAIRDTMKVGPKWCTIDIPTIMRLCHNTTRKEIVESLNNLQTSQGFAAKVADVRQQYRTLTDLPVSRQDISTLARQLYDELEAREKAALARAQQVIDLFTTDACIAHSLAVHYGMALPDGAEKCGHCSHCTTGGPIVIPHHPQPPLDMEGVQRVLDAVPDRDDTRFLARVAFGLLSPRVLRGGYTKHPVFGSLASQPFSALLSEFQKVCEA